MERKRKHTTCSGSPDFDENSADSKLAYMHGKHGLSLFLCVIFSLLYMLAQILVFRQTMADDPKRKSGVLFPKNDDLFGRIAVDPPHCIP